MVRPRKEVEVKKIDLVTEPSKIMKVIFRVPTSVPYESVEVEVSGLASLEEVKGKYNEIVESFRPSVKPLPPKEPMKSYGIPRRVPAADDEAGGAVLTEERAVEMQKLDIVAFVEEKHDFMCKGKSKKEISDKVFDLTGLLLEEANFEKIIDGLKK